jgi:hypothetical protein
MKKEWACLGLGFQISLFYMTMVTHLAVREVVGKRLVVFYSVIFHYILTTKYVCVHCDPVGVSCLFIEQNNN